MQTDLSPIAKTLVALLASVTYATEVQIIDALPDALPSAINPELHRLIRSGVVVAGFVRQGLGVSKPRLRAYWLDNRPQPDEVIGAVDTAFTAVWLDAAASGRPPVLVSGSPDIEACNTQASAVKAFNAITGRNLSDSEGLLFLQLVDIAAQFQNLKDEATHG